MNLVSNIQLMYAFTGLTQDMNAVVTYTDHYGTAKTNQIPGTDFAVDGSYYVITVDTLVVADARQDVTCVIYDGETEVASVTDSVESYTARASGDGQPLFQLLMKFADSAYAYFHFGASPVAYSMGGTQNSNPADSTGWVGFGSAETSEESTSAYSLTTASETSEEVCPANGELTSTTVVYEYIYASGKLIRETIDDTSTEGTDVVMDFFYDANGNPYAMDYNGQKLYYILNLQGDVICMVSPAGDSWATYTYDEWGNPKLISDNEYARNNPLRYRGYVYDSETGMYYCQSRYYDPAIRRWINADAFVSTGQGFVGYNMFAYCGNNPVNYSDSAGTRKELTTVMAYESGTNPYWEPLTWDDEGELIDSPLDQLKRQPVVRIGKVIYDNFDSVKEGFDEIIVGIALIPIPLPSTIDDYAGVIKIVAGIIKVGKGIWNVYTVLKEIYYE